MVKIQYHKLPRNFQEKFRSYAAKCNLPPGLEFAKFAEDIIYQITNLKIKYSDQGGAYNHDFLIFNNEKEYLWFTLQW